MSVLDIRPQERLLIELVPELPAAGALCNTAGRAQFAAAWAKANAASTAACWFLDLFQQQQSLLVNQPLPANLRLLCQADPPPDEVELVAWCFSKQGENELTREMLQFGNQRLRIGGRLAVATDNPTDQWLHEQLRGMFAKVTRRPHADGVVYLATKTAPPKKVKDYSCELTVRDGERLIVLRTRPGVFSHRELDGGARALLKAMDMSAVARVLDLGCGSGVVGVTAALRAEGVTVHATDSNPRAIEAALWAAERNGVSGLTAHLDCDGSSVQRAAFDLVLANPPYFSNFRIAELFLKIAATALVTGGRLLLVTKTPQWYADHLPEAFTEAFTQPVGNFIVLTATRAKSIRTLHALRFTANP
jgi:16S rRNA (guanine1207-N2)-methyltransferase